MATNKNSHGTAIAVGITALAAAAAGAYYLYGSDKAATHRKKVKSWMLRMKAEVMDEIETAKEVTQEAYEKTIDKVSKKYAQLKNVDKDELAELANRMRSHWKDIQGDLGDAAGIAKDKVKNVVTKKPSKK